MDQSERTLRDYAAGRLGTHHTIEHLGLDDFADLLIALARYDLDLPRPAPTKTRELNVARAAAILQPWLRHAG